MLMKACGGQFEEAESGRVKFPEENPGILGRAVFYLYTNEYEGPKTPIFFMQMPRIAELETEMLQSLHQSNDDNDHDLMDELTIHALVYKCADMLGIEDLKKEASERFLAGSSKALKGKLKGFEQPLEVMYESTRADDQDLRLHVTSLCVKEHAVVEPRKEIVEIILRHDPNVWNIAVPLLKKAGKDAVQRYVGKLNKARECGTCADPLSTQSTFLKWSNLKVGLEAICDSCVGNYY